MAFKEVDPNVSFPALEQEIEQWWKQHDIIKQALAAGDREQPFIFFEGPPTANGRPGVHHVEARSVKDIVIRYQRMRGKYVVGARGGWDTHGLPVEIEVEKELGFSGKPDIEKYGIAEFNRACKASVQRYIAEWERMTDRIAFWIDMENPYSTYDNSYIESLWWIFRRLWDDGLLFRDYKVTMHCPRCGTSLSDHEVSLGFRDDVDDPSVWVRFRVYAAGSAHPELDGAAFLAWTTTPWTLPANVALAVNPGAQYVLAEYTGGEAPERLVLAEALAERVLGEGSYRVLASYSGESLWGIHYERLFDGVPGPGASVDLDQAYHVVADDFVSLEDGTGIVHIAPAYGDLEIGRKYNLPTLFSVDLAGNTYPSYAALGFGGMFFKQADPLIMRNLAERGLLFRSGRVKHAYPFCWRCGTALLYYAKPSWYIRTTARKDRLLHNNQLIDWVPEHIKGGRFGNWLENNIDWAVSRERYWGTPLPIWISEDGQHTECIGSLAELEQKAGRSLQDLDLHRPYVDDVTWVDPQHGLMRRIPDVADCWFDSGAMQVAQWHYPFENQALFERAGQADYISEAIDQTRGWFYTLHALGTLLFDRPAFKHVICLGHILDIKGEKMSKSKGNVVDPWELLQNYGADATRWYMYASAPPYNPRSFAPAHVGEVLRQFVLTLWNTYSFFVTYANLDGWKPQFTINDLRFTSVADEGQIVNRKSEIVNPIDQWALARLHALVRDVTAAFDRYDIHTPAKLIEGFVDDLSNWYVRRNRRRFWKAEGDADKQAAYATLYTCLTTLSRLLAPFMPFLSEALYQNLVVSQTPGVPASVHLAAWPQADARLIDAALIDDTALLLQAIGLGRAARRGAKLKVRQPLGTLWLRVPSSGLAGIKRFEAELRDELNVKQVRYLDAATDMVTYRFKPNLKLVGKQYGKLVPALTAALRELDGAAAQAAAHTLEAGQPLTLEVAGQQLTLAPEAVLVESSSPEGYAVAEGNGVLIALDTSITPELRAEGQARELVRQIQDARKAAGLAIADRVALTLAGGDDELAALLAAWDANIQAETLAESLVLGDPADGAHTAALELDGRALTLGLRRVA